MVAVDDCGAIAPCFSSEVGHGIQPDRMTLERRYPCLTISLTKVQCHQVAWHVAVLVLAFLYFEAGCLYPIGVRSLTQKRFDHSI